MNVNLLPCIDHQLVANNGLGLWVIKIGTRDLIDVKSYLKY